MFRRARLNAWDAAYVAAQRNGQSSGSSGELRNALPNAAKRTCRRSVGAIGMMLVGILAALALLIGFGIVTMWSPDEPLSVDPTSDAYHIGYSNTYWNWPAHGHARALGQDPEANPYLT